MWDPSNMFLNGPYAPWREEGEAFDLEIEGQLPDGLSGALFRVGPSPLYRPQNPSRYHWFDGDGMVHAIFLRDGRATYRNRYVQTSGLKEEKELGRAIYGGFMNGRDTPLPPGKFPNNPANTHVQLYGDRLLAFCEGYPPRELRPDTLETVSEQYNFRGGVVGPLTAHHKVDPTNGDFLTFGNMDGAITWYRADRHGNILDRHSVDLGFPALTHDYAVTTDYAIWLVSPATARFERIMNGQPSTVWEPEKLDQCRWAVMHRRTGEVTWVEASDAFSTSHFLNAYQDGTKIIVDGHRVGQFGPTLKDLESPPPGGDWNWWFKEIITTPWRWELDLTTGKSRDIEVTDIQGEFPRINDQRAGLSHQYGYYTTTRGAGDWFTDGLAKHDYRTGETSMQTLDGVLTSPGEPVFVPRPGAQAEDDGWLLSIWWDPTTDRSEVIVQEAQDFTGTPIARIKLNHRVPMGFHGSWSDAAELDAAVHGA
ncbi:carotenoid oxygenase family protein [Streptomyces griseorubiginosus]|uniref:carotenoid oxygenase family protein n=1 Tax=Streptomyces griseorubiginosus TaxID=67304 RepID=UPI002E80AAB1|nr:carotenoid oxygenase family protein [Streptomyces griseorubiginosus]WUB42638.1 carotenoid oxygenase family protein [Streptomyces griseorubiginosus]WUB51157.1 carotenoid oxygenase family protein [Streptomyces griseorubiginosus]